MQLYTKILIGMLVGVMFGFLLGPNSRLLTHDGAALSDARVVTSPTAADPIPESIGIERAQVVETGPDAWIRIRWTLRTRDVMRLTAEGIEAARGDQHTGWVLDREPEVRRYSLLGRRLVDWTEWIGRLFLALIKMVVVPLVFFSLIGGIASLGDFRKLGKMGGATLGFFTITTVLALLIGLILTNLLQPGHLLAEADRAVLLSSYSGAAGDTVKGAAESPSIVDQIVAIVPENPFEVLAKGDMLPVIFFAMMLGIAFTLMPEEKSRFAVKTFDAINEAMVVIVNISMRLAPYGVAALLFEVVGNTGLSVLMALAAYGLVVLGGLALHIVLTYGTVLRYAVKIPLIDFIKGLRAALVLAFSTSSSSATLPVTKEAVEQNFGVSEEVSSFVLPIGATVNMDGTALYQGVAAIFIAQIYGIDLTVGDQATIVVSATLASVGAAGVPGAGMITLAMVLTGIGVPAEGVALVLGVDRVLDMFRTTTNVIGDSTATALIARMQGQTVKLRDPLHREENP